MTTYTKIKARAILLKISDFQSSCPPLPLTANAAAVTKSNKSNDWLAHLRDTPFDMIAADR